MFITFLDISLQLRKYLKANLYLYLIKNLINLKLFYISLMLVSVWGWILS
jgi:hypothetical protein